jgi:hypothetical protein
MTGDKTKDLARLEFLTATEAAMDQWTNLYETMLAECKDAKDTETARQMQVLLYRQFMFLLARSKREGRQDIRI